MLQDKDRRHIVSLVQRHCERFDRESFVPYLERKLEEGIKDAYNVGMLRYVSVSQMTIMGAMKGIATKMGKELYQPILMGLAGIPSGNTSMTGSGKVDFILERKYASVVDDEKIFAELGLECPPKVTGGNHRLYLVSVKTAPNTQSGSTIPGATQDLYKEIAARRKEGERDVVALFLNFYGESVKLSNVPCSQKNPKPKCYHLSGESALHFLLGDKTAHALVMDTISRVPLSNDLSRLLKEFREESND